MASSVVIAAQGLSYTYPNGRTIGFGLQTITSPGMTRIVDSNGRGKSTFLQLCRGDLRGYVGSLQVLDKEVSQLGPDDLRDFRRRIAFIKQTPFLNPDDTVEQGLHRALADAGVPQTERNDRIRKALAKVGLAGYADEFPEHLSGGQQQRVAIAEAIARRVDLILADEPLRHLDKESQTQVLTTLRELASALPVVIVEHDRSDIADYFTDVPLEGSITMSSRGGRVTPVSTSILSAIVTGLSAAIALYVLVLVLGLPGAGAGAGAGPTPTPIALSDTGNGGGVNSLFPSRSPTSTPESVGSTSPPPLAVPSTCPTPTTVRWSGDNVSPDGAISTPTDPCTTLMVSSGTIHLDGRQICQSDGTINCVLVWRSDAPQRAHLVQVDPNHNWWSTTQSVPDPAIDAKLNDFVAPPNCTSSGCKSATVVVYVDGQFSATQIGH